MGGMSEYYSHGRHERPNPQRKNAYSTGGVGFKSDGPSRVVAAKVQKSLSGRAEAVLKTMNQERSHAIEAGRASGMTADELADALNWKITWVRPRLTELSSKKRIRKTDMRRASKDGNPSTVWQIL